MSKCTWLGHTYTWEPVRINITDEDYGEYTVSGIKGTCTRCRYQKLKKL